MTMEPVSPQPPGPSDRDLHDPQAVLCALHTEAMEAYLQRDFEAAANKLARVREMQKPDEDIAAALLQERCNYLKANPPSSDWDGSEVLKQKSW